MKETRHGLTWECMDEEWKETLRSNRKASWWYNYSDLEIRADKELDNAFIDLRRKLVEYAGDAVCLPRFEIGSVDLQELYNNAEFVIPDANYVINEMMDNRCHDNSAIYATHHPNCVVMTGFALSNDGMWRLHSWVIEDDHIVETTVPRICYYGVETDPKVVYPPMRNTIDGGDNAILDIISRFLTF